VLTRRRPRAGRIGKFRALGRNERDHAFTIEKDGTPAYGEKREINRI
jgi:hypothetical protein